MGMHRAIDTESLHPHVQELRVRLWWSVFSAERLFAVEMGRPLAIDDSEVDAVLPVEVPKLRINGNGTVANQIAMAKLCLIMGKIVKAVYANRNTTSKGQAVSKSVHDIRKDLGNWRSNLPACLRLTATSSRAVTHLHLTYEQAMILLTRSCLNYAVADSHSVPLTAISQRFVHESATDCLLAAHSCIRMLTMLQDRALLSQFSFHDALYCSAALYVLLLGAKLQQPGSPRATILKGISVLYELAKGSDPAASSLQLICRAFQSSVKAQKLPYQVIDSREREQGRKTWQDWAAHARHAAQYHSSGNVAAGSEKNDLPANPSSNSRHLRHTSKPRPDFHQHFGNPPQTTYSNPSSNTETQRGLNSISQDHPSIPITTGMLAAPQNISQNTVEPQTETFWLPMLQTDLDLLG